MLTVMTCTNRLSTHLRHFVSSATASLDGEACQEHYFDDRFVDVFLYSTATAHGPGHHPNCKWPVISPDARKAMLWQMDLGITAEYSPGDKDEEVEQPGQA